MLDTNARCDRAEGSNSLYLELAPEVEAVQASKLQVYRVAKGGAEGSCANCKLVLSAHLHRSLAVSASLCWGC